MLLKPFGDRWYIVRKFLTTALSVDCTLVVVLDQVEHHSMFLPLPLRSKVAKNSFLPLVSRLWYFCKKRQSIWL